jgi:hypothetical protein
LLQRRFHVDAPPDRAAFLFTFSIAPEHAPPRVEAYAETLFGLCAVSQLPDLKEALGCTVYVFGAAAATIRMVESIS